MGNDIIDDIIDEELEPSETALQPVQETAVTTTEDQLVSVGQINNAVDGVKGRIVTQAIGKIEDRKIIDKHAKDLAKVADSALSTEIETERLKDERKKADNRAEKQSIKNDLIALKTEAIRLKREKKQILKEQRANHKKRNDEMSWEKYKGKLSKMNYTYVPNKFILAMLLFFDGIVSFFNGLGAVSTAIMKAVRWLAIIALILAVIFVIPVTRKWFTNLLGF